MNVIKRDGRTENVMFDKITSRIQRLCYGLTNVDAISISQKVIQGVFDGVATHKLDDLASEVCASLCSHHPEYSQLAGRITVSNLHKRTDKTFSDVVEKLMNRKNSEGQPAPGISDKLYEIVFKNKDFVDSVIVYDRDYNLSLIHI